MEIKFKKQFQNLKKEVVLKSVDLDDDIEDFQINIGQYENKDRVFTISPRCVRCDLCVKECPVDAISSATMVRRSKVNDNCVKCEICAKTCPVSCIYVMEIDSKIEISEDKVIFNLKELKVPHRVLKMEDINIDTNKCVVCGNCTKFCPTEAISIRNVFEEEEDFIELEEKSPFKNVEGTIEKYHNTSPTGESYTYINKGLCVGCGSCSNICPQNAISLKRYLGPIIQTKELLINEDICVQCDLCEESCPVDAIHLIHGRILLDNSKCIQCDVCSSKCPVAALTLKELS
jgi:ferredoxin